MNEASKKAKLHWKGTFWTLISVLNGFEKEGKSQAQFPVIIISHLWMPVDSLVMFLAWKKVADTKRAITVLKIQQI